MVINKKEYMICTKCNKNYKITFKINETDDKDTSIKNYFIKFPCKHEYIIHVDTNGNIRGYLPIDKHIDDFELIEMNGVDERIEILERKHDLLMKGNNYNEAFLLKKEISALHREKEKISLEINKNVTKK